MKCHDHSFVGTSSVPALLHSNCVWLNVNESLQHCVLHVVAQENKWGMWEKFGAFDWEWMCVKWSSVCCWGSGGVSYVRLSKAQQFSVLPLKWNEFDTTKGEVRVRRVNRDRCKESVFSLPDRIKTEATDVCKNNKCGLHTLVLLVSQTVLLLSFLP